jgi:SAM-dependent methyltransferase
MLARGACLVSTDISEEMMRLTSEKFQSDTDFHAVPGNKSDIRVEEFPTSDFDIEAHLKDSLSFNHDKDRAVIGRIANNESLPFKSESFDCYLACLSLMLVDNYLNMLEEAFRVCQSGATLAFTVWGRKENIQIFEILDDVITKHDLKSPVPPKKTSYDLGKDP